jgi:hypothetical protein
MLGSDSFMKLGKKGNASVGTVLAVTIGIILVVGVAIPVSQNVIDSANLTGLSATIVGFIPVFLAIGGLVLAAFMVAGRK